MQTAMKLPFHLFYFTSRAFPRLDLIISLILMCKSMSYDWVCPLISIILMSNYNSYLMKFNATNTKKLVLVMLFITLTYSACNGNCVTCNVGTCSACADGWALGSSCTSCDVGYYSTQGVCALCLGTIANCLECSGASTCTLCLDGYSLTGNCANCDTYYALNTNDVC